MADSIDQLVRALSMTIDEVAFSGVVLVEHDGRTILDHASGLADRAEGRLITSTTRLATASGTKGFTAVTVASLIDDGRLGFDTRIREIVGDDLPLVDPGVTIGQLLSHTSGVGDYLDEDQMEDIDDHVLDIAAHLLVGPEDYLPLLNRHEQTSEPGSHFVYNNSGYIMLALAIERVTGRTYHEEVAERVFDRAGMVSTDFVRSDRLCANAALGYLNDGRTNIFHLPVRGTGDGGAYTTAPDMLRFWDAFLDGRLVDPSLVQLMTRAENQEDEGRYYGFGFWIGSDRRTVELEGLDAGVSLRSGADPESGLRYCMIANNAVDVWPLASIVDHHVREAARQGGQQPG